MKYNFDLSEKEAEDIFETRLFPFISKKVILDREKKAYIVGGQPGSGKSSFAQSLLHENENLVFINGDDLRIFHPHYVEYLKENDQEAADRTQPVCNFWIEKAIDSCLERGLGFIVEGTMRIAKVSLETAIKAKEAGYEVNACVIAAPYDLSLASIKYRYVEAKKREGFARFTKKESHDEAFKNLPDTVQSLISTDIFSSISVFNRNDGRFELHNADKEISPIQLIEAGRARNLSKRELSFVNENKGQDGHPFPIHR